MFWTACGAVVGSMALRRFAQTGHLLAPIHCQSGRQLTQHRTYSVQARDIVDVCIVGGGIVGLATARELKTRFPGLRIVVLEKEDTLASHQTGRNSGVIHSGVYYKPNSLKARLCVQGNKLMYAYLQEKSIPFERCGKIIVAVEDEEVPRLKDIYQRGIENKVDGLSWLNESELRAVEPHCRGIAAVQCLSTGICDYGLVARSFGQDFVAMGGEIRVHHEVEHFTSISGPEKVFDHGVRVHLKSGDSIVCNHVITCAGVYADRLAKESGGKGSPQIVPFRGEYLILKDEKRHLVRGNIYPVPDPRVPFLGVHFTPRMDGTMWLGPNGVLAFAREGYTYSDVSLQDIKDMVAFEGFWKMGIKFLSYGLREYYRSLNVRAQVKQLQRYIPELTVDDVLPGPAGIRAQAVDADGALVDDFIFDAGDNAVGKIIHVRNAPSPAATSSLAIAKMIADKAEQDFKLL